MTQAHIIFMAVRLLADAPSRKPLGLSLAFGG